MLPEQSHYHPAWDMLREVARERAGSDGLRVWWGFVDDLAFRELEPQLRIARHFGLGADAQELRSALRPIEAQLAGDLLNSLSTAVLQQGFRHDPPEHLRGVIATGLASLGSEVRCYTNVDWDGRADDGNFGIHPVSNSRFDAGLIGHNGRMGFLVWIEENDGPASGLGLD